MNTKFWLTALEEDSMAEKDALVRDGFKKAFPEAEEGGYVEIPELTDDEFARIVCPPVYHHPLFWFLVAWNVAATILFVGRFFL